jgi:cytochrome c-type biogenesis protein CcmH
VMCPICGTLLELSDSPQANREKVFIRRRIAEGETKAQIKDALVAEYGDQVLALPKGSGFDLTAYLVPIAGFLIAAVALAFAVLRWRRRGATTPAPTGTPPKGRDAERLDADIARYDL